MMSKKILAILCALPLLALAMPASAQTDLTCSDITFNDDLTSRFPQIADACIDVVEDDDGNRLAKFTVEVVRARNNGMTFRFVDPESGAHGPTQSVDLDPSWRVQVAGRSFRARELAPGQELNVYLPSDRWEAHVGNDAGGTIVVFNLLILRDAEPEPVAMLPSTAGYMPLFALFGGMALFSAFLIRVFRRR